MIYTLDRETELRAPLTTVFSFFADASNLGKITPPELHFAIHAHHTIDMREGTIIDYTIRLWGLPLGWRTRISSWDPPNSFVDEQLEGPYKMWTHTHSFEAHGDSTMVRDHVEYELPFGIPGRLAHPLVKRQLHRIFSYRRTAIERLFGASSMKWMG